MSSSSPAAEQRAGTATLGEVAGFFLRLGFTAFGGPAAHLAIMESETVRRRGWLTRQEFLDRLGAVSLLPGPSSTQMQAALVDVLTAAILLGALVLMLGTRLNPTWIVLGAGAAGLLWQD